MPRVKTPTPIYSLKVTLLRTEPPIWRRIEVPSSIKLCCLHSAIQISMGWTDSHLHQFEKDEKKWGMIDLDEIDTSLLDEKPVPVSTLLTSAGDAMIYRYDFGDGWRHQVVLEKILPPEAAKVPICIDGQRRCPPEDVGGIPGYERFLEIIFDPTHAEYEQYVTWVGGHFHDTFDRKAVNQILSRMRWPVRHPW